MKVLNFFRIALCTVAVAFASSCVDPNQEPTINFPEATSYDLAIDQELELSFKAETTWKLTTDKDWLKFVDPVLGTTETLDGPAGDQTIKITTANVTSIFDEETAVISIEMGGQSKPLYNITRTAVARWAKMFLCAYGEDPVEITEENPLVAEYNEFGDIIVGINFQANFAWKVSTWPDWIDMQPFAGEANQTLSKTDNESFYVKESAYACAQTGEITITDMNGNNPFSFPVSYAGMSDNAIKFTNANGRELSMYGTAISFSPEGFVVENNITGETETTESTVATVSVLAKNYEYAVVILSYDDPYNLGEKMWMAGPDWITVTDDAKGTLSVSVQANGGKAREAYICVIPKAMIPATEMDHWWYSENEDMLEAYTFVVKQASSEVEGGFYAMWTQNLKIADCIPFNSYPGFKEMGMTAQDMGLPSQTYVYEIPEEFSGPLGIHPLGFPEGWVAITAAIPLYRAMDLGASAFPTDQSYFESAYIYDMSTFSSKNALIYSADAIARATAGYLQILFYADVEAYTYWQATSALVLVKK